MLLSLSAFGPGLAGSSGDGPQVKKSRMDYCHERGSPYYEQTKRFKAYESMEASLASGGKRIRAPHSLSRKWWDDWGFDTWWTTAPYWVKDHWLWIAGALLAPLGFIAYCTFRRDGGPGMTIPRRWRGSSSQDELERKRWEGHRIDRD